jgi:hypothetical protein
MSHERAKRLAALAADTRTPEQEIYEAELRRRREADDAQPG